MRSHRPSSKRRGRGASAVSSVKLPQIELTEGQRREGTGLLLIVLPWLQLIG